MMISGECRRRQKNSIFSCMRYNWLFSLSLSLTHSLAVIASEFNYFFFSGEKKKTFDQSQFLAMSDTRNSFFFSYPPMSESHETSHIHHLDIDRCGGFHKATTGRRFSKGKLKDDRTGFNSCVTINFINA